MNIEVLKSKVPAAFADNPHPKVSAGYNFFRTADIIQPLQEMNFTIRSAWQQKNRKEEDAAFAKHMLEFRKNSEIRSLMVGDSIPIVRVLNSHNWSSRLEISFGLFRLACKNGLTIPIPGQSMSYNVRHDAVIEDLTHIMSKYVSATNRIADYTDRMRNRRMDDVEVSQFVRQAAEIRFGEDRVNEVDLHSFGAPRRADDSHNNLWNVYNRVQENGVHGGPKVGNRKSRSLNSIDSFLNWNNRLFELATTYNP
jgi:hypothetical protein